MNRLNLFLRAIIRSILQSSSDKTVGAIHWTLEKMASTAGSMTSLCHGTWSGKYFHNYCHHPKLHTHSHLHTSTDGSSRGACFFSHVPYQWDWVGASGWKKQGHILWLQLRGQWDLEFDSHVEERITTWFFPQVGYSNVTRGNKWCLLHWGNKT